MNSARARREYDAPLDSRKRLTLRGAEYSNYHVIEYEDGSFLLEPRMLVSPPLLSHRTLAMMDEAVDNLERGMLSEPVDPDELLGGGR
jgi:hypothetical protein